MRNFLKLAAVAIVAIPIALMSVLNVRSVPPERTPISMTYTYDRATQVQVHPNQSQVILSEDNDNCVLAETGSVACQLPAGTNVVTVYATAPDCTTPFLSVNFLTKFYPQQSIQSVEGSPIRVPPIEQLGGVNKEAANINCISTPVVATIAPMPTEIPHQSVSQVNVEIIPEPTPIP